MPANGHTIIQQMEKYAPKSYAMPDDRIGLQVGTLNKAVEKVLVALDVTDAVVDEAVAAGAGLIIAHHAVIYRPLKQIRTDLPDGRLFEKLIKHDIAVYASHTNLDVAPGGINDMMAEALQLTDLVPIEEIHTERLRKLAVYVPVTHHEQVREAIFAAGAGWIGDYSHCSFNLKGVGTFRPESGTDPYIGKQGVMEQVEEMRIETILPESVQSKVIQAMLKAHPYEEVAYDLYPLDLKGRSFGLGRVGKLPEPILLDELAERVKQVFDVPRLRVVGDGNKRIRKVGVLGGSGGRYAKAAQFSGADVLVTGDVDYHVAHDALADGFSLIDPGHHVEKIMKQGVADVLNRMFRENKIDCEAIASTLSTEPFRFV